LLDRALEGETIAIARAGEPLVRLVPVRRTATRSRVTIGGPLAGRIHLAEDFFAPVTGD
jgi:antitoxin (DNA-binding transcriptional repressor) of toxin-antitoxin stability system